MYTGDNKFCIVIMDDIHLNLANNETIANSRVWRPQLVRHSTEMQFMGNKTSKIGWISIGMVLWQWSYRILLICCCSGMFDDQLAGKCVL